MIKSTTKQRIQLSPELIALLEEEHKELTSNCDLIFRYIKNKEYELYSA